MTAETLLRPRTEAAAGAAREAGAGWLLAISVLGAALSMLVTGFNFGQANNYFHLPIVERLYDEPQFRDDAFIQSLRYFAAGPFLLLEGSARYVSPEILFPILTFLSRVLTFVGLLLCARLAGVQSRRAQLVFVVVAAFSQLLRFYSLAGGAGLMIPTFTHSEIANGLLLISVYFAARDRFGWAFVMNGLVFFTNAFMAVWNAVPLLFMMILALRAGRITPAQILRRGGAGLAGFAVLAAPVVWNIVTNPEFGQRIGIDYRAYLVEHFPYHFIFSSNTLVERVLLGAVVLLGAICFVALGPRARMLQAAFWGFVAVYGIGIVVPSLTDRPLILNLHLLRSSALIQILTAVAVITLVTRWLLGADWRRAMVVAPLTIVSICSVRAPLLASPLLVGAGLWPALLDRLPASLAGQWRAVAAWARQATPPDAMFMVPTAPPFQETSEAPLPQGIELLNALSHRRIWIDFRSGAAVMWAPSFYPEWHERVTEQMALHGLAEKLAFARAHDIAFVVEPCGTAAPAEPVFRTKALCVYASAATR